MKKPVKRGRPARDVKSARASVSLPTELHQMLDQIAKSKKVSFAWVMRDAAEQYVAAQWPLFGKP
jgi:predicted transcriptional regulator